MTNPKVFLVGAMLVGCTVFGYTQSLTTFILVRHAEKATNDPKDPDLSDTGRVRARRLAELFATTEIAAVYSTNFKRTLQTAEAVASQKKLPVKIYQPHQREVIEAMVSEHQGKTVLLVGHSNTIPWTANLLLGNQELKDFADSEYGTILIVTISISHPAAQLLKLNY
jgi:2,3-bisphosphoglycerate-dependent phosphoglycerate mutase